jgi:hypothetical protein
LVLLLLLLLLPEWAAAVLHTCQAVTLWSI